MFGICLSSGVPFFLGFFHRMCRLCLRLLALACPLALPLAGHLFRAAGHTFEISLLLPQTERRILSFLLAHLLS